MAMSRYVVVIERGGTTRGPVEARVHNHPLALAEMNVEKRVPVALGALDHHGCPLRGGANRSRSPATARWKRALSVPSGVFVMSAISRNLS